VNQLVRFWVLLGSLVLSLASLLYLFLSFLFPTEALFVAVPGVRIVVTGLALVSVCLFVWAAILAPENHPTVPPGE